MPPEPGAPSPNTARTRAPFDLYLVTDPSWARGVVETIARALEGAPPGRVGVLVRDASLDARALGRLAEQVIDVARPRGARVLVSDDVDVASCVGADGVHLRESSVAPEVARARLAEGALVGASRHDRVGVASAAASGADFVVLAPFLDVPGKGPSLGAAGFRAATSGVGIPVLALGGIDAITIPLALTAGAAGVAVRRAISGARDPSTSMAELLLALDVARPL